MENRKHAYRNVETDRLYRCGPARMAGRNSIPTIKRQGTAEGSLKLQTVDNTVPRKEDSGKISHLTILQSGYDGQSAIRLPSCYTDCAGSPEHTRSNQVHSTVHLRPRPFKSVRLFYQRVNTTKTEE